MISGKSELRLFDEAAPQAVIDSAIFMDVNPTTSLLENSDHIEFVISGSDTEYLDLNDSFLCVRLKVTTADNKVLPATSANVPCNFFLNGLFRDVTLTFNDTIIEGGNHLYPYKSTIDAIFNFDRAAKAIQLRAMGFDDNIANRKAWIAESHRLELVGSLRLDFFNQPKYLLPGVNVKVSLQTSQSKFSIIKGSGNPKVKLESVKLYVRRVKVNPSVIVGHNRGLEKRNAVYPYNRGQVISYTVSQGSMSHFKDNLFSNSLLPKFVIVGFVSSQGFSGTNIEADPFKFEHFNVNSVGLFRDGQSLPYRELYEPDFQHNLYTREYVKSIIQGTQHLNTNVNNGIGMEAFARGGYTFFTFNLTPDFDYNQRQMPRDGNLRLEVKFASPLEKSINVIVYGIFDAQLQITKDRKIICDNVH